MRATLVLQRLMWSRPASVGGQARQWLQTQDDAPRFLSNNKSQNATASNMLINRRGTPSRRTGWRSMAALIGHACCCVAGNNLRGGMTDLRRTTIPAQVCPGRAK